jgi:BASS family bile acid:Na+ symporter
VDLATAIRLAIVTSMVLLVLSLGLRSVAGDAGYLFRRPQLLVRSILAMNILMPLLVLGLLIPLDLRPPVKVALVALSVSPVPPFLPAKQLKLANRHGYIYGLLLTSALLSVILVPLTTAILESFVPNGEHVTLLAVARVVLLSVILPLTVGILLRRAWPARAPRLAALANNLGSALLIVAFLPVLFAQWAQIRSLLGDGTLLAVIGFVYLGLLVGHMVGGPDSQDRTVLALATASRHPAVALAVAAALFPDQKLAPAAVLLSLIVGILATVPYSVRRQKARREELRAGKSSPATRGL